VTAPAGSPGATYTARPGAAARPGRPYPLGATVIGGGTNFAVASEVAHGITLCMLSTLLLSSGIPLLLGGDEIGRTQQGNNNAYCQDNEISWYDWSSADTDLLAFTRRLIALRARHPVFRRRRFLSGADARELGWFTPAVTDADWKDDSALSLGIYLDGSDSPDRAGDGSLLLDDDFYLMVNGYWEPLTFTIPSVRTAPDGAAESWRLEISTYDGNTSPGDGTTPSGGGTTPSGGGTTPSGDASTPPAPATVTAGGHLDVGSRSLIVCRARAN
jgi:pullulanase/glycogen debranching enzyme